MPLLRQAVLTNLDLSHAYIGDSGAKLLSHAMPRNRSLVRLSLPHNRLTSNAVVAIAAALRSNATVTQVRGMPTFYRKHDAIDGMR